MPRYYYHLGIKPGQCADKKLSMECRDTAEAIVRAYMLVLKSFPNPASLEGLADASIDVTDRSGTNLFSLPVSSVVTRFPESEAARRAP
jgi:hypothetical protein